MPACQSCAYLDNNKCRAHVQAKDELKRPLPPAPTGACTVAIVESYLPTIQKGMKVLEIGCGSWSKIKEYCEKVGALYEGLDVQNEYYGLKSVATKIGNLAELDYSDETFDLVIGNQTMEHWAEYGCTLSWGLLQCFRVLKLGGLLYINVPIHFHGTKEFVHGRINVLEQLFNNYSSDVIFESWGNPTDPIEPYFPHPDYKPLKNKPAYVMDIRAVRNKALPNGINNTLGFKGKAARILHYSLSYNIYLLKKKVYHAFRT